MKVRKQHIKLQNNKQSEFKCNKRIRKLQTSNFKEKIH